MPLSTREGVIRVYLYYEIGEPYREDRWKGGGTDTLHLLTVVIAVVDLIVYYPIDSVLFATLRPTARSTINTYLQLTFIAFLVQRVFDRCLTPQILEVGLN